ncbi:TraB/GumN family protein [Janthinobacterium agaricidamnosum]|nr:TraB/GumN family protein [Janthinobacterium agaricidamnosum]
MALPAAWAAPAAPPAKAPNRGALFKVEQGGHTLYLFGTIHVGEPGFFPLEPRVTQALKRASVLALEVDPNGDQKNVVSSLVKYGMDSPGQVLENDCRPALLPRLAPLLKKFAIAPESAAPMKPWLLASVLAIGEFSAQGYKSELAVDSYLSRQAHARKIPVLELESMESQMGLFGNMSMADQCRFLEEGLDGLEDQDQVRQAREMAQAWGSADAAALDKVAQEATDDKTFSGKFMQQVLLEGRNPGLADGIAKLLGRENNSLAAIGVLHLIGANSVPDLLRKRGLKVERVY